MIKVYLRFCLCVAVLLSLAAAAQAQSVTVKGKVTSSDDGTTMPGVNIVEKGTSNGTVTDANGEYSLTVSEGATLVFSFVGYTAQQLAVSGKSVIDVSLVSDFTSLSEVMVVGYGTVQKKDLTGSVAKIGAEDFNKGIYLAPAQLLQGRVAGVSVVGSSGAPGAETTIRVRGVGSIRAGNDPLIVVDGVQIEGGSTKATINIPGGIGETPGIDPLSFINPNDIASFDVLKDASATAIYGSRGANGVIMITTKRNSDEPRIDFSASGGVSFLSKKLETMTANQYRDALDTEGLVIGDYGSSADAFDEIIQTGSLQNYNIAFSSAKDKSSQQLSLGYTDQKGIIKESGLKKFNAMLKSDYNFFNDRVKVELLLLGAHVEQASAPIGN
ncbi:MAG TPA: TonB-dependent receptor plug domain-containing protein, partial [Ohtaekwangia sp.]